MEATGATLLGVATSLSVGSPAAGVRDSVFIRGFSCDGSDTVPVIDSTKEEIRIPKDRPLHYSHKQAHSTGGSYFEKGPERKGYD